MFTLSENDPHEDDKDVNMSSWDPLCGTWIPYYYPRDLPGQFLYEGFISQEEEDQILNMLDTQPPEWREKTFNGKQRWGQHMHSNSNNKLLNMNHTNTKLTESPAGERPGEWPSIYSDAPSGLPRFRCHLFCRAWPIGWDTSLACPDSVQTRQMPSITEGASTSCMLMRMTGEG